MRSILYFYKTVFPQAVWRHRQVIVLAGTVFFTGALIGMVFTSAPDAHLSWPRLERLSDVNSLTKNSPETLVPFMEQEFILILSQNLTVIVLTFLTGIFFGVGTLVQLLVNGAVSLGVPLQMALREGSGWLFFTAVIAHAPLELFAISLAGGAGLLLGLAVLFPAHNQVRSHWQCRLERLEANAKQALILMSGAIPLIVIATFVEVISMLLNPGFSNAASLNAVLLQWICLLIGIINLVVLPILVIAGGKSNQSVLSVK